MAPWAWRPRRTAKVTAAKITTNTASRSVDPVASGPSRAAQRHQQPLHRGHGPPWCVPRFPALWFQPLERVLQQVRGRHQQPCEHAKEHELKVNRQERAQESDHRHANVARARRCEVATIAAQPLQHMGVAVGQTLLRRMKAPQRHQPAPHAGDIAATRHAGEVVHAAQQAITGQAALSGVTPPMLTTLRQTTQQAQTERGAAHATA
jgi:hypothetical protein